MVQPENHLVRDYPDQGFVYGLGPGMVGLNAMAIEISRTNIPVLLVGESGTGKDAYARLIHRLPMESDRNFIRINCAATNPADLLTELQEVINVKSPSESLGTIYLDNVQELDSACQRVLTSQLPDQEVILTPETKIPRFIASSTRNLEPEVESSRFRRDLYFRLNGACLRLPPLRERPEDIPIFLEHYLEKDCSQLRKKVSPLNRKTLQTLEEYHWPGNIRELKHFVQKIVVFGDAQLAVNDLFSARISNSVPMPTTAGGSLKVAARAASKHAERQLILQALERTHWNRKRAAQELQISYKSLLYKIKQIGTLNEEYQR